MAKWLLSLAMAFFIFPALLLVAFTGSSGGEPIAPESLIGWLTLAWILVCVGGGFTGLMWFIGKLADDA